MRKLLLALALGSALVAPASAVVTSTLMGNAALTASSTDQRILLSTAFTASRTLTLPAAGATCIGQTCPPFTLEIFDPAGTAVNGANTLVLAPVTGDTINGSASSVTITGIGAGGKLILTPSSGSNWILQIQGTGQTLGTTTNDNACTGCVGEFFTGRTDLLANQTATTVTNAVVTSAPVPVTTVVYNVTQVLLTPGDWECRGQAQLGTVGVGTSTAATVFAAWTSTANQTNAAPISYTNAFPTNPSFVSLQAASVSSPAWSLGIPPVRYSVAAATSVFLNAVATFSAGTPTGMGALQCRRVR